MIELDDKLEKKAIFHLEELQIPLKNVHNY